MIKASLEIGKHPWKLMIINKELYKLRSSTAQFHEQLAAKIRQRGFILSKADQDLQKPHATNGSSQGRGLDTFQRRSSR